MAVGIVKNKVVKRRIGMRRKDVSGIVGVESYGSGIGNENSFVNPVAAGVYIY